MRKIIQNVLFIVVLLLGLDAKAQCPILLDEAGMPTTNAEYLLCSKDPRTLFLNFDKSFGAYTVNWGDGTANTSGTSYIAGNPVSHVYAAGVNNFTLTITIPGCPTITARVVKEEPTTASIQVPFGGVTRACAPATLEFVNSSTNNSSNTTYIWNFGDGTPNQTFNSTNLGQTVPHLYNVGTVDCGTKVTLTAFNKCNIKQGSVSIAEYSPILIWDLDKPAIGSDTLFCYPDTVVTYTNTTRLNCIKPGEGNVEPRTEYWRFIDYFGPGLDSIIDWRPFGPPRTLRYPGIGTYRVELRERSFCGEVNVFRTIRIIAAPKAGITASKDTICIGEQVTFTNATTGPANVFNWNPDDGTGWKKFNIPSQTITYSTDKAYKVRLAVDVFGGSPSCKDTAIVPVVVVPNPKINFTLSAKKGCDALNYTVTNNTQGAVNYAWNFGQGFTSTSANPPQQTYATSGRYFVDLIVSSAKNCKATSRDTVYVYKSPVVSFTIPEVCLNTNTKPVNNTVQDATDTVVTWLWQWGDGTTSATKSPSHKYASDGTFTVQLKANSANCEGNGNALATVNPLPTINFLPSILAGCSPLSVNFSNQSVGSVSYNWSFGDGGTATDVNPSYTYTNTTGANRNYTVKLVGATTKQCKDSVNKTITVFPAVKADFTFDAKNNCLSLDVDFKNNSPGATTFSWDFGDGTTSNLPNPSHSYTNSSSFVSEFNVTLRVSSANGCSDVIVKKVQVNPDARFGFTATPDSGCSPLVVNFTAKAGAASYVWEFPDGSTANGSFVSRVFFNTTSAEIKNIVKLTATTSIGCIDKTQDTVVVFPDPTAAFQVTPSKGCSPLSVSFTNNSLGAAKYAWDYGNSQNDSNATTNFSRVYTNLTGGSQIFSVKLTAISPFGCKNTSSQVVEVFPEFQASFDTVGSGCTPFVKNYLAKGGDSYVWDFGNGQVANTSSFTPTFINNSNTSNQNYTIRLIASSVFGCKDTVLGNVTVFPKPLSSFAFDKNQGCAPLNAGLSNKSVGASQFQWFYGDGEASSENGLLHTYLFINNTSNPKNYQTRLIAISANGCMDTSMQTVMVFPLVKANFAHLKEGCDPLPVTFFNTSSNAGLYNWEIEGSGGSTAFEPKELFRNLTQSDRILNIQLIARSSFGCVDTAKSQVKIFPKPKALFGVDKLNACQPISIAISNNSVGTGLSYLWNYGQGPSSTTAASTHNRVFTNNADTVQTFKIELIATNSFLCADTSSKIITVYPKVQALFDPLSPGCSPLKASVLNRSIGAASIEWDFAGQSQSTDNSVTHAFVNDDVSDQSVFVRLIARNVFGCADTLLRTTTVYAVPKPNFTASPQEMRFPASSVFLQNTTPNLAAWLYTWSLGDGDFSSNTEVGTKKYATWGKYTIVLEARSAFCRDSVAKLINIIAPFPKPSFEGGGAGCKPYVVRFRNTSEYSVGTFWDFGDGGTSEQENPTYTYFVPGTYTVSLKTRGPNGEDSTILKSGIVEVFDNAEAFFIASTENARTNVDPVDFENLSKRAETYYWDFGDGFTSIEKNPTHFYAREGVFDVTLIADNQFSCPDTFKIRNAVTVAVGDEIVLPTAFTPNQGGSSGGKYDPKSLDNDIFYPFSKDVEVYKMEIFSRWGEKLFESNDVSIGWDGYYNNKLCQQDVYVYKVVAIFKGGRSFEKIGDVTLLR